MTTMAAARPAPFRSRRLKVTIKLLGESVGHRAPTTTTVNCTVQAAARGADMLQALQPRQTAYCAHLCKLSADDERTALTVSATRPHCYVSLSELSADLATSAAAATVTTTQTFGRGRDCLATSHVSSSDNRVSPGSKPVLLACTALHCLLGLECWNWELTRRASFQQRAGLAASSTLHCSALPIVQ